MIKTLKRQEKAKIILQKICAVCKSQRSGLLMAALFLGFFVRAEAATITANSPSLADVSLAINSAANGDTVIVPPGTATWTNSLVFSKNITLQGSNMPVIVDEVPRSLPNPALILATANRNGSLRITGLTFKGGVTNTGNNYDGVVRIYGICWQCRVDHCSFTNLNIVMRTYI